MIGWTAKKNTKFAVQISFIPKLSLPLSYHSQTNKTTMTEVKVKYSKHEFYGYTHRFVVTLKVDDDSMNDTRMDIYSNSDSYEKLEEFINQKKAPDVLSFKIEHRATKEADDAASKMIDDWINGEL
jgi:hypothetical protein